VGDTGLEPVTSSV